MLWLLLVAACLLQSGPRAPIDVSSIKVGSATIVADIDIGKLKGEPRQLAWSPDQSTFYLQTAEGNPPIEKLHHYTVSLDGGAVTTADHAPDWAVDYWNLKQDRVAPGVPSLVIEIEQKQEVQKVGVGPAGALNRTGDPSSSAGTLAAEDANSQRASVVKLRLLGEDIGVWVNERVIPGTRFGWGPSGMGALVYVGEGGHLVLFDRQKHRQVVPDVKDALLPAWSPAGDRLAYLRKTGRRTYALAWSPLTAP